MFSDRQLPNNAISAIEGSQNFSAEKALATLTANCFTLVQARSDFPHYVYLSKYM
ncbi:MAG: hypothetical protein HC942_19375 [Microcoleus sp. SU_5_6]|nr:hypothetical protein [Microcoleus sp. SU_5_6]NJL68971.1 hypothetical protein [Microcoleus sp. SM1_3_4]